MKLYSLLYTNGLCGVFDGLDLIDEIKLKFINVNFMVVEIEVVSISAKMYVIPAKETEYPIYMTDSKEVAEEKLKMYEKFGVAESIMIATLNKLNPLVLEVLSEL